MIKYTLNWPGGRYKILFVLFSYSYFLNTVKKEEMETCRCMLTEVTGSREETGSWTRSAGRRAGVYAEFQKLGSKAFLFPSIFVYFVCFFLTNGAVFLRESPSSGRFHLDLLLLEQTEPQEIGLES